MARQSLVSGLIGKKVEGVRVVPVTLKIITIFIVFLLVSSFISNYLNLTLNRSEQIRLTTDTLIRDLKDLYLFSGTQYKMYRQTMTDQDLFMNQIKDYAQLQFKGKKSIALGINADAKLLFAVGGATTATVFSDRAVLDGINASITAKKEDGSIEFLWNGERYFGIWRYSSDWKTILLRAEEWNEFYEPSVRIFTTVSWIIAGFTLVTVLIGVFLLRYILRFMRHITESIMAMQESQRMDLIEMKGAPNDEVTYLGLAINNLSGTIQNLVEMFKKFVARDVATQAYNDGEIRLVGAKRELAIMFSDIKGFTFMTETLGNDIIRLLNLHYSKAIRCIHSHNGDIGSIIGDAILAIFGTMNKVGENKSLEAVRAGYEILDMAEYLRQAMDARYETLRKSRGDLLTEEERVYMAVRLEVGVGLDGGEVFYGNIGSNERMVNTVIGDNVNSSSRLEGLTRIYKVPMIVSDYIRQEVLAASKQYFFLELDIVQVKGKTIGKRIFHPIPVSAINVTQRQELDQYQQALSLYYEGRWPEAYALFRAIEFPPARVFEERTAHNTAPANWSGIWTMTEK